ncbi:MAG TPA: NUDIX hydrolase [Gemmataceae bacterium]|nr:NUDIX hydrolase [Gemmataceae bacterium]
MSRRIVHRGRKIQVAVESSASPDGRTVERDVILHPGAAAILPLVDREHVCLLRNRRPVVDATLWEIPAGTLEPGEAPEVAAVRELVEETGYTAATWRKLTEFYPSPGVLTEITHVYLATDLTAGSSKPEAGEDLEPQVVAWRQALNWALDGTIRDAKTLIALLLWERLRNR